MRLHARTEMRRRREQKVVRGSVSIRRLMLTGFLGLAERKPFDRVDDRSPRKPDKGVGDHTGCFGAGESTTDMAGDCAVHSPSLTEVIRPQFAPDATKRGCRAASRKETDGNPARELPSSFDNDVHPWRCRTGLGFGRVGLGIAFLRLILGRFRCWSHRPLGLDFVLRGQGRSLLRVHSTTVGHGVLQVRVLVSVAAPPRKFPTWEIPILGNSSDQP